MTVLEKLDIGVVEMRDRDLRKRLESGMAPKLMPVFGDIHDEIIAFAPVERNRADAREHAELIARYCTAQSDEIARMAEAERGFQTRIANAVDIGEERAAIIDFSRELGADRKQLQSDRKALHAFLDTDAIVERFHKRIGERERALAHAIDRLGIVAADAAVEDPLMVQSAFFVELFENLLAEMRSWKGDARVRCAAHRCLCAIAGKIQQWPFGYWFETVLSATRRVAMDESEDVWVQCAAFDALLALSPNSMATAIASRIIQPMSRKKPEVRDQELFLRRHLVHVVCANYQLDENFPKILEKLADDESGAVRQAIADRLHLLPPSVATTFTRMLRADDDPQVRAALFADISRITPVISAIGMAGAIGETLANDSDEFVQRIALDAAAGLAAFARNEELPDRDLVFLELRRAIVRFQNRVDSPKLLRWADEACERVWLASEPEALEIAAILRSVVRDQSEAEIRTITAIKPWLAEESEKVGRVMAILAQGDFGLSIKRGVVPRIQRGEWIKRRFWRFLFEGGNSATDKRQAFKHTTGRHYFGTMIAPSARMAELAPTKVPGEPLFESSEGGWRNYIPLVDQVLAALDHGQTLEICTSAGITELTPPSSLLRRTSRFWRVSRNFSELADKRNRDPAQYLETLRTLGFETSFRAYDDEKQPNQHVAKVFSGAKK